VERSERPTTRAARCVSIARQIGLLKFLEEAQVDYIGGMAENKVKRRARRMMSTARRLSIPRAARAFSPINCAFCSPLLPVCVVAKLRLLLIGV
jgi:hypothetical protein